MYLTPENGAFTTSKLPTEATNEWLNEMTCSEIVGGSAVKLKTPPLKNDKLAR